jgi:hypothetical protein
MLPHQRCQPRDPDRDVRPARPERRRQVLADAHHRDAADRDLLRPQARVQRGPHDRGHPEVAGYYTTRFTPYQHKQVRILEFPNYASFAQSFANTIPFSESIGFIADLRDKEDIDYVFYVTVKEKPFEVGVDPYNKMIDRVPRDNRKEVGVD